MPNRRSTTAKALTIMAIGMGVGFGTCTLAAVTSGPNSSAAEVFMPIGAFLFFVCLAGIAITGLIVVVNKILEKSRR